MPVPPAGTRSGAHATTGVYVNGAAGAVVNSGSIIGSTSNAINLLDGGSVTNTSTGLIRGFYGVATGSTPALTTVTNSGTIIGTASAGVALDDGGTVINSGTVSGGGGVAISFGGHGATATLALLVLDPGYSLVGTVAGSTTAGATNTLELASAASAGTLSSVFATEFTNFGTVTVDSGARWTLTNPISTAAPIILNAGTLLGPGAPHYALSLTNGGSVGNTGTGLIEGYTGVYIGGASGTVTNFATIEGTAAFGRGIDMSAGGSVNNIGLIGGDFQGLYDVGAAGTISNSGTIEGASGITITVGTISNSGTVTGTNGLGAEILGSGAVINTGTIQSPNSFYTVIIGGGGYVTNSQAGYIGAGGVKLSAGGTIVNAGQIVDTFPGGASRSVIDGASGLVINSGTVTGTGDGIDLNEGGTVIDSGTVSGGSGRAIDFGGSTGARNLLALERGYDLVGLVANESLTIGTLELAGSVGAAVTVGYSQFVLSDFQDALFGPGGNATLAVSNTAGTLPVTLSGFTLTSDIVDLTALANGTLANGGTVSANRLTVSNGVDTVTLQLDASDATVFTATAVAGGTEISPACFCRGTLIWSERGEVAVEELAIGDRLITLSGAARRVKWIGRRAYDGRFVAANRRVLPIQVAAGALAPGLPERDLRLSPEHALYLDGALVPAGLLVNGATIRQVESVDQLEYFHIELERHDVILAEGAPAETFVDCDSRGIFHNAGEFAELYPDDVPVPWAFCAPRVEAGSAELAVIRAVLAARAEALDHDRSDAPAIASQSVVSAELKLAS